MPFPAKTDRTRILAAAMEQLTSDGMQKLSLRSLATALDLAPNALYRYFDSRSSLEAALTAEITTQVYENLRKAAGRKSPELAIRALARSYVLFAREHPHLYDAFLTPCLPSPEGHAAHTTLWQFVLAQVARISGEDHAANAAVSLWALLHGFLSLEIAGVFEEKAKPLSGLDWGINAWFHAARTTSF